jgi:predicted amidophosphoribosyltransferase
MGNGNGSIHETFICPGCGSVNDVTPDFRFHCSICGLTLSQDDMHPNDFGERSESDAEEKDES